MRHERLLWLVSVAVLAGCGPEWAPDDEGSVGEIEGTLVEENALTENALTQNALTQNALTQNALTQNALTQNGLIGSNGLIGQNALTQNALTDNGFTSKNGLGSNGLIGQNGLIGANGLIGQNGRNDDWQGVGGDPGFPNGLGDSAVDGKASPADDDAETLPAIQDPGKRGALARQFLRYLVSCAFDPTQTLDFTWIDARGRTRFESYAGSLGVAPQWATGPLGERGERMVSACIAARVNHYGVPVRISLRSQRAPLHVIGDGELEAFPVVEGAFWGNLWADPPYLFACHVGENAEHARETQRACAAGHLREDGTVEGCGMIQILGDCAALCRTFDDAGQHYSKCADVAGDGRVTHDVITTALP